MTSTVSQSGHVEPLLHLEFYMVPIGLLNHNTIIILHLLPGDAENFSRIISTIIFHLRRGA